MNGAYEGLGPEELPEGAVVRDEVVRYHLMDGARTFVAPGRRVIDLPGWTWRAARPEECENGTWDGKWIEGKVLLCTGCGLDCT
jgi:hypothetical protein